MPRGLAGGPRPGAPVWATAEEGVLPAGPPPMVPSTLPTATYPPRDADIPCTGYRGGNGIGAAKGRAGAPSGSRRGAAAASDAGALIRTGGGSAATCGADGWASPAPGAPQALAQYRDAATMRELPKEVQAAPVARGKAAAKGISELLAQALEEYRRKAGDWPGPAAPGMSGDVGALIEQALAASRQRGVESTPCGIAAGTEEAGEGGGGQPCVARPEWTGAGRGAGGVPEGTMGHGAVEPRGGPTKDEGVEECMWEWRDWRQVAPGELCPAGLVFSMDLATGTNRARLPEHKRALLDRAEAGRGRGADERPLAPFPSRPESPPADAEEGEEEGVQDVAAVEGEEGGEG